MIREENKRKEEEKEAILPGIYWLQLPSLAGLTLSLVTVGGLTGFRVSQWVFHLNKH